MATRSTAAEKAQLVVSRPEQGETQTYLIKPGMTVAVTGFTFSDGVATIRGEDLVIQFPDGSQIVLQDFVEVAQYSNPPTVVFDDGTVLPGSDVLLQVAALEGAPVDIAAIDADMAKIEPAAGPTPSNLVSGGLGSASNFAIGSIGGDGVAVSARPDNVDFGRGSEGPIQVGGPTGDGLGGGTPTGGNDAPNAFNATLVVDDDAGATAINIPAPTDANGDTLTVTITSLPNIGTLLLNGVPVTVGQVLTVAQLQALTFDPNDGQFGNTSFNYSVNDGNGGTDTGTVTIVVNEQDGEGNNAPNAFDATLVVDDDATATAINIPAPTDADGDTLSVTINSLPTLGVLMLNGVPVTVGQVLTVAQLQALTFDPANGQFGNTSFTYTVNDGNGGTDTGTVNIVVNEQDPQNQAPNAFDATLVVDDDATATAINIPAPTDADGDALSVTINSLPTLGVLMLNGVPVAVGQVLTVAQLQALTFDPANGQFGNTGFTYTVNDGNGGTDTGTVTIVVNEQDPANQAPNAFNATLVVDDDATATAINIPAPTDADGDTLSVTINTLPSLGTLLLNGVPVVAGQVLTVAQLQALTFDPANGQFGNTGFTYTVNDGNGGTDTGTVTIVVNEQDPANNAPNAFDATLVVDDDAAATALNIPAPTDADGDSLTVTINSLPGLGVLLLNGQPVTVGQVLTVAQLQALSFDPANGQFGNTSFTYTVNDGNGGTDVGTVNINVNEQDPANTPPVAFDATLVVDDDAAATALNIPAPTDANGDVLSVTINSLPGLGVLLLNGQPVTVGQVLTVAQLQALSFDPANGQFGNTSFTYTVNDGHGGTDTGTININVNEQDPANTPPVAFDATLVVDDDAAATALNIPAPTDANGDVLTVTINSLPGLGVLLLNGQPVVAGQVLTVAQLQALSFDPANGQFGNTSFTYTVNDGHGGTDVGTININVNEQDPANQAPNAFNATLVVDDDATATAINIPAPTDADGDTLSVTINSLPGLGVLLLNGQPVTVGQVLTVAQLQALSFDPANNNFGNTSFNYTVNDGHGGTDVGTVNIVVNEQDVAPINHNPVALDQTVVMDEDAGNVALNIVRPTDVDGDSLSVTINSVPGLGTLLLNGQPVFAGQVLTVAQLQALTFNTAPDANGNTSFTYTVNDGHGGTDGATVNIIVNPMPEVPVNQAPNAFDVTLTVDDDASATALNIPRPTDPNGDPLTVTINSIPGLGVLLLNGQPVHAGQVLTVAQLQALSFDPANNQFGNTGFTYTVNDGRGGTDVGTVSITVNEQDVVIPPTNHAPVALDQTVVMDEDAGNVSLNILRPTDVDGDALSVTINGLPGLGTLMLNGQAVHVGQVLTVAQLQALTFSTAQDANGSTSFSYTVNDGHGGTDGATVNIIVNPMPETGGPGTGTNHAPVAWDQTVVMDENNGMTTLNVLRPTDVDGDALSIRIDSLPGGTVLGLLTLGDGSLVTTGQILTVDQLQSLHFTPFTNANGSASFSYTVMDGRGGEDGATVHIVVNPVANLTAVGATEVPGFDYITPVLDEKGETALQAMIGDQYETPPTIGPLHLLAVEVAEQIVVADFNDSKPTWQFDEAHEEIALEGKGFGIEVLSDNGDYKGGDEIIIAHDDQMPVIALWDTLPVEPVQQYHTL